VPSLVQAARWAPYRMVYGRPRIWLSELRKARIRLLHPGARIEFGADTYLGPGFSLHMPYGGTFVTGEDVEFRRNFRAELAGPPSRISFGAGAICTYDVLIQCSTTVDIGARSQFGQSTIIVDGNHRFRDPTRPMLEQGYDFRPITIGDDVTVLSKVTIIASIGERALIGANAVVTRAVPPFTVALGVPARPVEYFGPPQDARAEASA